MVDSTIVMDLLSPLSRLLGISQLQTPKSSSIGNLTPARGHATRATADRVSVASPNATSSVSTNIATSNKQASNVEGRLIAQLRSLPPQDLRHFIGRSLPFLSDPNFTLKLARAFSDALQLSLVAESSRQVKPNASTALISKTLGKLDYKEQRTDSRPTSTRTAAPTSVGISDSYQVRDKSGVIWRVWHLPFALDEGLDRIRIYSPPRGKSDSDKGKKDRHGRGSSRLVFALELSHTGALEIEAEHGEDTLRVVIRTQRGFSKETESKIRRRFVEILEDLSLRGQLAFYQVEVLPLSSLSASEESRLGTSL